jgi:hypothetical protein
VVEGIEVTTTFLDHLDILDTLEYLSVEPALATD